MSRPKTVFIVGAGASHEASLPTGDSLKKAIAAKLDLSLEYGQFAGGGDEAIYRLLHRKYPQEKSIQTYVDICAQIRAGIALSSSIDDFIDTHRHDPRIAEVGKLAIARSILEAERASKLFYERRNIADTIDFPSLSETWYPSFYRWLSHGIPKDERARLFDDVTVICFNYDRCIEHFLAHAISAHYQVGLYEEGRPLAEKLAIYHPYGSVGDYFAASQEKRVEFGAERFSDYDRIVSTLRTYTEQIEESDTLHAMREAISVARVLVFLGNAFHSNNMRVIQPETVAETGKRIYFTRCGISDADLPVVWKYLADLRDRNNRTINKQHANNYPARTCYDLFDAYRMSLAG